MADVERQKFGQYISTEMLLKGSTSSLYLGQHSTRKKTVLIKLFHTSLSTKEGKEAFAARAKQLKKLTSRNSINVQDYGVISNFGEIQDCGYLVMENVAGETLQQQLSRGELLPPVEIKYLLAPLADALNQAHKLHLIHANLHPGTILLHSTSAKTARKEPLLTNFAFNLPGLALDEEPLAQLYRAPEHLKGTPTEASDQYSLAVIIYELINGERPYAAEEPAQLLQQQSDAPRPPKNKEVSQGVSDVLNKALAFQPEERFAQVQDFSDAYLRALMGLPFIPNKPKEAARLATNISVITTSTPGVSNGIQASLPSSRKKIAASIATMVPTTPAVPNTPHPAEGHDVAPLLEPTLPPAPVTPRLLTHLEDDETIYKMPAGNGTKVKEPHAPFRLDEEDDRSNESEGDEREPKRKAPPPMRPGQLLKLVNADLHQGGVLSKSLPGYEERPAQVEMAALVTQSLEEETPAIIEASTGTGKSLAYLVPVVRSGKVAIISTANKALQEQLFYKDIPFVQKYIKPFDAALVKGMGNYVCLDRMESERIGIQFHAKSRDFARLVNMTEDPESNFDGDFETLGFKLAADIKGRISADTDQCAWSKCGYFSDCYVREMRENSRRAQVIVVNHTLLLLDAAMDGFLLPERDVIIVDEAHHLEDEATRAFTTTVNPNRINSLLSQRMLKDHSQLSLQDEVSKLTRETWETLQLVADPGLKGRVNLKEPVQEGLHLATVMTDLADSLRKQKPKDLPEKEGQLYDKLLKRAQNLAADLRKVFAVDQQDKNVYYVELSGSAGRRDTYLQVSSAPLEIKTWLQKQLLHKSNVICTSATLATMAPNPSRPEEKGPNFSYFKNRIGFDSEEIPEPLERILPLTFDYESNALLYLPQRARVPEPAYAGAAAKEYTWAIAKEMGNLVTKSRGRAFLLFSSKRMLDECYDLLAPILEKPPYEYPLLRQGEMTRLELTRTFRETEGAVLFGLKSFWEGVDIAGEALSLVVIDKLPFDPPDDPVHEARINQMKAAGENWFGIYVLPQAILRLKQGLGRLLRSREDRGVMAILDTRLQTKGYGRMILNALPPARKTSNIKDVEGFFTES